MSSIPGYNLEAFLAWNFSITVESRGDANVSVAIAEVLGNVKPRPHVSEDTFAKLVALYEPYRQVIENRLDAFDEDNQSWRSYAEYVDCDVPADVVNKAEVLLASLA